MSYARFAIYYVPPEGELASFGAHWLGWDLRAGAKTEGLDIAGRCDVTMTPRKYGFHGTLKPPFRLAEGCTPDDLRMAVADLACRLPPAQCDGGLALKRLGRFLALALQGETTALNTVAAACVTELDRFRAPADAAELAKRRGAGLPPAQEENLLRWGYPYVLDAFRFHMTLTGRLPKTEVSAWEHRLQTILPALPAPFVADAIAFVGERADGRFEMIQSYALTG